MNLTVRDLDRSNPEGTPFYFLRKDKDKNGKNVAIVTNTSGANKFLTVYLSSELEAQIDKLQAGQLFFFKLTGASSKKSTLHSCLEIRGFDTSIFLSSYDFNGDVTVTSDDLECKLSISQLSLISQVNDSS